MRFVKNKKATRQHAAEMLAQSSRVIFIDQQLMRDQEPGMRGPGIDSESTLKPEPPDIVLVKDFELQAETIL